MVLTTIDWNYLFNLFSSTLDCVNLCAETRYASLIFSIPSACQTHVYCHSVNTKDLHVKGRWHLFLVFCKALPFTKTQLPFLFASLYTLIILLISRIPPWLEEPFHFLVIVSFNVTSSRKVLWLSSQAVRHFLHPATCLYVYGKELLYKLLVYMPTCTTKF